MQNNNNREQIILSGIISFELHTCIALLCVGGFQSILMDVWLTAEARKSRTVDSIPIAGKNP